MAAKAILILCAQALFIQSTFSACTSRVAVEASGIGSPFGYAGSLAPGFTGMACDGFNSPAWAYDGLAYPGTGCAGKGLAYDGFYSPATEFTATSGGALPVTSSSTMAPGGISIVSENVYEGALNAAGEIPFVGTCGLEGVLATAGSGAVNYACGNGLTAITALSGTSTPASVATAGPVYSTGLAYDGLYGPGLAGSAFGANTFACDRLSTPGFAAPVLAYDALSCTDAAWTGRGLACDGLAKGSLFDGIEIIPTSGGALPVSSVSTMSPTGIIVVSDNAYEGALAVGGELPFVSTVALEGVVPSAGAGAVNHACGNGRNAMISETSAFGPAGAYAPIGAYSPGAAFAPSAFAPGFGASACGFRGDAGRGCGCAY